MDWFASLRATPVFGDRSMSVLSVIMREAETMGLRPEGSNPCPGIRRYRRKGRARFLSVEEIRTLSERLSVHAEAAPLQVDLVRLLLLTGCRKSEILTLQWSDYREGHLHLRDSKTGPSTVWLSRPTRTLLDGLGQSGQRMFPAARGKGPRVNGWLEGFWFIVRAETGLLGVRLHDLRHFHVSHAVLNGSPVPVDSRLLDRGNIRTTLRYAHLGDRQIEDAAAAHAPRRKCSHQPPDPRRRR